MTTEKPTLEELTAEAAESERALMLEADQIKSDTFLTIVEQRRRKVMQIAAEVVKHMRWN